MKTVEKAGKIIEVLLSEYPDARPALSFSSPFELLIAVILSQQCTDERVNIVTGELFKKYNTPQAVVSLFQAELEKIILPCGLYRNKAKNILSAADSIIKNFGGEVPDKYEDLLSLSGVGRKTANVIYSVAFGGDAIAVDTHVFRVAGRLGLSKANTPEKTEKDLMNVIPKNLWSKSHHLLIFHGRRVCKARNPLCGGCGASAFCSYFNKKKS